MQDLYVNEVYKDMEEFLFFNMFPKKPADANKGSFGKILLISGSYGMAGAASLNIIGAKSVGASYIHVALSEDIYPIVAGQHITPVFHPFSELKTDSPAKDAEDIVSSLLPGMKAVCFGSGAVNNFAKTRIFNTLNNECKAPLVLDAEALKLIKWSGEELSSFKCPLILTPHQGEFSALSGISPATVTDKPVECATAYAADKNVIMVLKGPRTVVAAPDGRYYVNKTGNNALAQAGSGDVLAGMITAMLSFVEDPFAAACMAVYMHGRIADLGTEHHSRQCFRLEDYPEIADGIFFRRGF